MAHVYITPVREREYEHEREREHKGSGEGHRLPAKHAASAACRVGGEFGNEIINDFLEPHMLPTLPPLNAAERAAHKRQTPGLLWFTGVSGAGKSTIAALVERSLFESGQHTYLLDADTARAGLNADLGFSAADRIENVRRLAECAKLMVDAGLVVLVTSISPNAEARRAARQLLSRYQFIEIFVDTPITVAQQRDPKGLYAKFANGQLNQLAGLDAPYDRPLNAEIVLNTVQCSAADCAAQVMAYVQQRLNA